jgi:hypothetical protein
MHAFLDKYSVTMTSLLMKNHLWFNHSIESPSYKEILDSMHLQLPNITKEGIYEVPAACCTGFLDPAFEVIQWIGRDAPTLIYHHGNNEQPFSYHLWSKNTFRSIVLKNKEHFKTNIINMKAPFHTNKMSQYLEKIGHLKNFTAMLCGSAALMEALIQHLKTNGSSSVTLSGLSLGGWVVNLHKCFFDTADAYVPMLSGAALDQLFTSSYYKKLTSKQAKEHPDVLKQVLNFEKEYSACNLKNVFPLLARFDQFIVYETQSPCYGKTPVKILKKGHITSALSSDLLHDHLLGHLPSLDTRRSSH